MSTDRPALSDHDIDELLISAVRHALGRCHPHTAAWTADLVVAHEPWLSEHARRLLAGDIRHRLTGSPGEEPLTDDGTAQWRRALDVLDPHTGRSA